MRKFLSLLALLGASGWALAGGSTINTSVPAQNALISSAPIRGNFAAAFNDINNLFGQSNGALPPLSPLLGQLWLNTSGTPYALEEWDGSQWVVQGYMNATSHAWAIPMGSLPLGTSVNNPGTGTIETLLSVQTVTQTSRTYGTADLFKKTRRANTGVAMTDTFPVASTSGLANGAEINIANVDTTALLTLTAGTGTTIDGLSSIVIPPGRDLWFTYDSANTTWRGVANTRSMVLFSGTPPTASQLFGGSSMAGQASTISLGTCLGITSGVISDTCAGTVSSVGLTLPASLFSITGSPVVGSGTLNGALINQSANQVFSGPASGGAATPGFRALVGADLPTPSASSLGGIESIGATAHSWINAISTAGVPAVTQPAFTDLSGSASCSQEPALTGDVTTTAGTCSATLAASGVTAGSCSSCNLTIDAKGRVTAQTNGAGGGYPSNYLVKTANYTAGVGDNIIADTTSGPFTITLPASPSQFNQICVSDAAGTFSANTLTIAGNGSNIMSSSANMTVTTPYASFCLIYYTSTPGWRLK